MRLGRDKSWSIYERTFAHVPVSVRPSCSKRWAALRQGTCRMLGRTLGSRVQGHPIPWGPGFRGVAGFRPLQTVGRR